MEPVAVLGDTAVECIDVVLQAVRDVLRVLTHAAGDLAAIGFDGAVKFRDMARDEGAERAAIAGEFFCKL